MPPLVARPINLTSVLFSEPLLSFSLLARELALEKMVSLPQHQSQQRLPAPSFGAAAPIYRDSFNAHSYGGFGQPAAYRFQPAPFNNVETSYNESLRSDGGSAHRAENRSQVWYFITLLSFFNIKYLHIT